MFLITIIVIIKNLIVSEFVFVLICFNEYKIHRNTHIVVSYEWK